MKCFVYILYSEHRKQHYVAVTNDLNDRLHRHNSRQNISTKSGVPWRLICSIECEDKSVAMRLESKIKGRGIGRYLSENNIGQVISVPLEAGTSPRLNLAIPTNPNGALRNFEGLF